MRYTSYRLPLYITSTLLMLSVAATSAFAGTLVLDFTDEAGAPAVVTKAELLLSGWGYAGRMELPHEGGSVTLTLDADGLKAVSGQEFDNADEAYIYIEADGYAPTCSDSFGFPGNDAVASAFAIIPLPGGGTVTVNDGETVHTAVRLRRPGTRLLFLTDDDGRPVAGVSVLAHMYWTSANHCARLTGVELIADTKSGPDGLVDIPDGDIIYAFEIAADDTWLVLADPALGEYPDRLVTRLGGETTEVRLHRRTPVELELRVTRDGKPAGGELLSGCMADCPGGICAACCGPVGTTGPDGVIRIERFNHEYYTRVMFEGEDGELLWEIDPRGFTSDTALDVELGARMRP